MHDWVIGVAPLVLRSVKGGGRVIPLKRELVIQTEFWSTAHTPPNVLPPRRTSIHTHTHIELLLSLKNF